MFQNLKQKTRNRKDISKLLVRLMYKVALLEKEVSEGGSGGTPTLQEVTDEGNETTNDIIVGPEFTLKTTYGWTGISASSFGLDQFGLYIGNIGGGTLYTSNNIQLNPFILPNPRGILNFPDLGDNTTEETVATQEWVSNQNIVKRTKVTLTPAQINNLGTTPVEVIPAQGAGTYIRVMAVDAFLNWNSVAYDSNIIYLKTNGKGDALAIGDTISNLLDKTENTNFCGVFINPLSLTMYSENLYSENTEIVVSGTDSVATGDSTVDLYITYEVVTL